MASEKKADIGRALRAIAASVTILDHAIGEWMNRDLDLAELASKLYAIREKRKELHALEAGVESQLARACPTHKPKVPGWRIERHGGTTRKWQDDGKYKAFEKAVIARFTDIETGEVHEGFDLNTALEVCAFVVEIYGSADPKTTPFKELAVDLDEYTTRERSRQTVTVEPQAVEDAA